MLSFRSLNNQGLSGFIPTEIGLLSSVTWLDFSINSISGTIPSELFRLTGLSALQLQRNFLTGSLHSAIGNLRQVTYITMNQNQITSSIPTEIGLLSNLQIMGLHINQLLGTIPTEIAQLRNIVLIYLAQNKLEGEVPTMTSLATLASLDLSANALFGDPAALFNGMLSLSELSLKDNQFRGDIRFLQQLPSLQYVYLSHNQMYGSCDFPLPQQIAELSLAHNMLDGSFVIEGYDRLAFLDLSVNRVANLTVRNNALLVTLVANDNQISTMTIDNLTSLYRLDLSNNNLTEMPDFLYFGSSLTQVNIVSLRGNYIDGAIPSLQIYNTPMMTLDLSYNYLLGDLYPTFAFYSPYITTGVVTSKKRVETEEFNSSVMPCYCFPDPSRRQVNIFANRLTAASSRIMELSNNAPDYSLPQILNSSIPVCDGCAIQIITVPTFPQDFDDCLVANGCAHYCLDGWSPVLSYTCGCYAGYVLQSDLRSCSLNGLVGLFAIPIVLLIVGFLVSGFLARVYFLSPLHSLPKEVAWSFMNQLTHPWFWEYHGDRSGYYYRKYEKGSVEYQRVEILTNSMFKNRTIELGDITAIFNHELTTSFVNHWKLTITRKSRALISFSPALLARMSQRQR